MGRALGLDVGTKTIGVAVSDDLRLVAHPIPTLARAGVAKDVERLRRLVDERQVDAIVVGLPLELDGTEERSARLARQIGAALASAVDRPVVYVDERFSSVQAERRLIAQGMSRERRKAVIDGEAAAIILQQWLDHGEDVVEDREDRRG